MSALPVAVVSTPNGPLPPGYRHKVMKRFRTVDDAVSYLDGFTSARARKKVLDGEYGIDDDRLNEVRTRAVAEGRTVEGPVTGPFPLDKPGLWKTEWRRITVQEQRAAVLSFMDRNRGMMNFATEFELRRIFGQGAIIHRIGVGWYVKRKAKNKTNRWARFLAKAKLMP